MSQTTEFQPPLLDKLHWGDDLLISPEIHLCAKCIHSMTGPHRAEANWDTVFCGTEENVAGISVLTGNKIYKHKCWEIRKKVNEPLKCLWYEARPVEMPAPASLIPAMPAAPKKALTAVQQILATAKKSEEFKSLTKKDLDI